MSTSSELAVLLKKYIDGSIIPADQERLEKFMQLDPILKEFVEDLLQGDTIIKEYEEWLTARQLLDEQTLQQIKNQTLLRIQHPENYTSKNDIFQNRFSIRSLRFAISIAAVIFVFLGVFFVYQDTTKEYNLTISELDLAPAINKTTLILSNGQKVILRNDKLGVKIGQEINYTDGTKITSLDEKELTKLNATIHVPKGSTYNVILPDGSRVILNAMSTLSYPLAFPTNSRQVHLSGEGYFDIAKKFQGGKKVPFILQTNQQMVNVTGTQFNIRAYPDEESTICTLMEGGVTVSSGKMQIKLKPNEQASNISGIIHKKVVDAATYIAWTKDKFLFNETELAEVLSNISRWYDIEIHDLKNRDDMHFYGEIARNKKLSEVLNLLERSGVKFQIKKHANQHHLYVLK
ncbi:FecR family protein [Sphingobacterium sp. SGL-16]|uniref:FecR family protein n=1 Tax=Sphingobacterium sp. SGL-16 TaxID=2710883 RepID=UPI0013EBD468|nr:FecR family protein [Sphingobacterium sp. SGL-16]NGM73106.1 DUF4974 domain-containing protein [Sphingobacterium sp. SGL-16]